MPSSPRSYPSNYNALFDPGFRAARGVRAAAARSPIHVAAIQRLRDEGVDLAVEYNDVTRLPVRVENRAPRQRLSSARLDLPIEQVAVEWIQEHRDLWQLSEPDAATVEVISTSTQ